MDLERGALANLDRWLLAGLDRDERFQMVRVPVLAQRANEQLANREAEVAGRERAVASAEERLRSRNEQLRRREAELQTLVQRVQLASKLAAQRGDSTPKVGRNDRCPCGSGLKYKYCHGLTGRPPNAVAR